MSLGAAVLAIIVAAVIGFVLGAFFTAWCVGGSLWGDAP